MATSITTNNAESISYKQKQALVQAYAPQIRLHPSEKYFPADIDFALAACELRANDGSDAVIHDRITSQSLLMQTGSVPMESTYVHIVDEAAIIGNPPSDIGGISIFAKISTILYDDGTGKPPTEFWDILYNIFYMHNGSTVPGSTTVGAHSWDNETVIVRILPNYAPSADMIETIFFSQHSGGGWFKPSKLQFVGDNGIGAREAGGRGANNRSAEDTHVVAYAAKYSHAHYPAAATWPRMFGVATDYTSDGGIHWIPTTILADLPSVTNPKATWTLYTGRFGQEGQRGVFQRGWITMNHKLMNVQSMDLVSKALKGKRVPLAIMFVTLPISALVLAAVLYKIHIPSVIMGIVVWVLVMYGIRLYSHIDL